MRKYVTLLISLLLVISTYSQSFVGYGLDQITEQFEDEGYELLTKGQSLFVAGPDVNIQFMFDEYGVCHTAVYKATCNCLEKWDTTIYRIGFTRIDTLRHISKRPVFEEVRFYKNGGETVAVYTLMRDGKKRYKKLKRMYNVRRK